MRELSLFTGIGGGLLGTHLLGWTPIGYVEINEYCQRVIAQRIADGILPAAPIFTDVREFVESGAADQYRGIADVVTAGFPCQPFSVAGRRRGADDERNMWPSTADIIRIVQPRYAFLENVPGLLASGYFHTILADLAEMGMDARWGIVSAAGVGAPHLRERLWIVAHSTSKQESSEQSAIGSSGDADAEVSNANKNKRLLHEPSVEGKVRQWHDIAGSCLVDRRVTWWEAEPDVGRLADGIPHRVDRLRAIGNGQVPAVVAAAWHLLTER